MAKNAVTAMRSRVSWADRSDRGDPAGGAERAERADRERASEPEREVRSEAESGGE
ncbi:hypothetical protein ACFCVY_13025 [Streptomyces sp. NPDC056411]|uniref:hypothetical protein n=1 Tax=Streptomyces sp. NPDC056411 TaxID=3345813 RepID=UPI0035DEFBA1